LTFWISDVILLLTVKQQEQKMELLTQADYFAIALLSGVVTGFACAAFGIYVGGKIADITR
jgi:hypothetical protein